MWVQTKMCGCGTKSYLLLPHSIIVWVRYIDRDEYAVDIYASNVLIHGEVIHANGMIQAREKATCVIASTLARIAHPLEGLDPTCAKTLN